LQGFFCIRNRFSFYRTIFSAIIFLEINIDNLEVRLASYAQSIAEGRSLIYVMREKKAPEKALLQLNLHQKLIKYDRSFWLIIAR
jgi:hypothetical protein